MTYTGNVARPSQPLPMPQAHILVVNDDISVSMITEVILVNHGYRVTKVKDGRAALGSLRSETPDLMLLDIQLPDMDGIQVIATMRELVPFLSRARCRMMTTAYAYGMWSVGACINEDSVNACSAGANKIESPARGHPELRYYGFTLNQSTNSRTPTRSLTE